MSQTKPVLMLFLLFIALTSTGFGESGQSGLEEILPPTTYRNYLRADYPDRLKILRTTIQNICTRLKIQVGRNEQEEFLQRLAELKILADEAWERNEATTSLKLLRHKEVKRMEIFLRQKIDLLEDLKLDVGYEIRGNFYPPLESMDRLRKKLFLQLFEGARDFENDLGTNALGFSGNHLIRTASASPSPVQGLHDIDRFTEDEFRRIQVARELKKRIEVLLEIAESRLTEIDRRKSSLEWTEEEPNPLEFYTYDDLLHAYNRALEATMHSIDEHHERGLSQLNEIEKALEELKDGCEIFQPRLKGLEELIKEIGSLELAMKLSRAQDFTTKALEGTEAGLESLKKKRENR